MEWIDISVFISSTFNDMHAERDLLMKKVFPELSEWCARRHIRLFDIDLRWGVTTRDSMSQNTVEICLRNVDRCRPFFLCFLGQRRGWVPDPKKDPPEINPKTLSHYPGIVGRFGKRSVTEMEIEHALLAPMRRLIDGQTVVPEASENALFFIRDGSYVFELNDAQRLIFTNRDTENEQLTDEEHASFIRRIRSGYSEVYDYDCRFDKDLYSAELSDRGNDCAQGRLTDFSVHGERMDSFVLEALKGQILKAHPERAAEVSDEAAAEADRHLRRAEEIRSGTVEREDLMQRLCELSTGNPNRPVYVYGETGSGKSTVLSGFMDRRQRYFDQSFMRFCGASASASKWSSMWEQLLDEAGVEIDESEDFDRDIGLPLRRLGDEKKTLIIIDGLDELQEGLSILASVPHLLPDNVRMILSFRKEGEVTDSLIEHLKADGSYLCEIKTLGEKTEVEAFADAYLKQYLKALDDAQLQAVCDIPAARNPLFLKIILRELRTFGAFSQIGNQISGFGETPKSAFGKLLKDLKEEISYNPIEAEVFVSEMTAALTIVRGGIKIGTLRKALSIRLCRSEEDVSDTLAYYFRRLSPYLMTDGSVVGIVYNSLREAAAEQYKNDIAGLHGALAAASEALDPLECLYHYRMADMPDMVGSLSQDIRFLCRVIKNSGALALLGELRLSAETDPDVLSCLKKIAHVIGNDSSIAAPLFYKELSNRSLRQKAADACTGTWFRYEPIPAGSRPSGGKRILSAEYISEYQAVQSTALASKAKLAYQLTGESELHISDLHGTIRNAYTLPVNSRVRKLVCTPGGEYIAVATEDLSLSICRITSDENHRILAVSLVADDSCSSVRFGGISLFGTERGMMWQRADGMVVSFCEETGIVTEEAVSGDKLTGCFDGCTSWKIGRSYYLKHGSVCIPAVARINDVVIKDGRIFIATEDKKITGYDSASGAVAYETGLPAESAVSLAQADGVLFGVDRYGTMIRVIDGVAENLGRITQGDSHLDTDTQLMDMEDGSLAFVSTQRSALLMTKEKTEDARIAKAFSGVNGANVLWDLGNEFTAMLAGGIQYTAPYPEFVLKGSNVNEKSILKAACSDRSMAYEDIGKGLHIYSPEGEFMVNDAGLSEMGGLFCDLQYAADAECFQAVTHKARLLEITEHGEINAQTDLPRSESDLYIMCICGKRTAVLSRRVKIREDADASAYFADVLSVIDNGRILWTEILSRQEDTVVKGVLYNKDAEQLILFYMAGRIECWSVSDGKLITKGDFPVVGFERGAAIHDDAVYYAEGKDGMLTARMLHSEETISLPSHRRVMRISEGPYGLIVQEGDERLFSVSIESFRD